MTEMSILVDDELKAQAEQVFNNAGVTMSTAVSFFLRQVVAHRELPFPLPAHDGQDPVYNPAMLRRLHQSIEHAKQGKYVVKTMEELRRMEDE
ncbi:MAG: type II toxin-antitoxin system RelB/DinJ family antitoxin [Treponema sp.]|jgi:DNA-damage-inducible protein J|nr:type II toxin-antitoxin system RelB/DinJ family antitoxin [Treponema sp.]